VTSAFAQVAGFVAGPPDSAEEGGTMAGIPGTMRASVLHGARDLRLEEPPVLGQEFGGTIVAVVRDVDPARVGERVSVEPQHPSATSRETLRGAYNLDPAMRFLAARPASTSTLWSPAATASPPPPP
jgi:threonine dehydrogenase-like Zn-dependent dehydrogenase